MTNQKNKKELVKKKKLKDGSSYKAKSDLFLKAFYGSKIVRIDSKEGIKKLDIKALSYESKIELERALNLGDLVEVGEN